jgi:hypothetical protein
MDTEETRMRVGRVGRRSTGDPSYLQRNLVSLVGWGEVGKLTRSAELDDHLRSLRFAI